MFPCALKGWYFSRDSAIFFTRTRMDKHMLVQSWVKKANHFGPGIWIKCNGASDASTKKPSTKKKEGHPPEGSLWRPLPAHGGLHEDEDDGTPQYWEQWGEGLQDPRLWRAPDTARTDGNGHPVLRWHIQGWTSTILWGSPLHRLRLSLADSTSWN